jgi:hypothetical protein
MTTRSFISRTFELGACIRVGTSLQANVKKLIADGVILDPKLNALVIKHGALTSMLDLSEKNDMRLVDRGTDTCVGGFHTLIEGTIAALQDSPALPLPDEADTRLNDAERLLALTLPEGTGFLLFEYKLQWEHLRALEKALGSAEVHGLCKTLGLQIEQARVLSWIELYGKKQGITEHQEESITKLEQTLLEWHTLYEKIAEKAKGLYDSDNKEENEKRQMFLSPYLNELTQLREEGRKRNQQYRDAKAKKDSGA